MAMDFFAGCVGGCAGVIVGHPLDTVKVRIQTQTPDNIRYSGTFQALIKIAKQESVAGLYKGISSPLYGVSLVNALVFGVYGCLQPYVLQYPGNNSIWAHSLAGAIAGAAQSIICSPMELVKIRMQINESSGKQPSSYKILRNIYTTSGIKGGVFKGWLVTLAREIPGFGTYFGSYELFTHILEKHEMLTDDDGQIGTLGMMLSGGSAGVVSWLACFPMDVIKTRFQSDTDGRYFGVWDCVKKTYHAEGYQVFTRTLPSLLIRAFPMSAVTFPVVTWILRLSNSKCEVQATDTQEIDSLFYQTKNLASNEIYKRVYNVPQYHLLTPHVPTIPCLETQNSLQFQQGSKNYRNTATICPCCSLGESPLLVPLFHDDEDSFLISKNNDEMRNSIFLNETSKTNKQEGNDSALEKIIIEEKGANPALLRSGESENSLVRAIKFLFSSVIGNNSESECVSEDPPSE